MPASTSAVAEPIPLPCSARGKGQEEPKWFTLADLTLIVAALAVGMAFRNLRLEDVFVGSGVTGVTERFSVFWTFMDAVATFALGTTLAILARRASFGGMPRPAEWFSILLGAGLLCQMMGLGIPWPGPNSWRNRFPSAGSAASEVTHMAPLLATLALLTLALRPVGSRPWARTVLVAGWLSALLCGPIGYLETVTAAHIRSLLAYATSRSNPADFPGAFPAFFRTLFYGIPAAAVVLDRLSFGRRQWVWVRWTGLGIYASYRRHRASWVWTEWASLIAVSMLALYWLIDIVTLAMDRTNPDRYFELKARGLLALAIAALSILIVRCFGRAWGRWIMPDSRQLPPIA